MDNQTLTISAERVREAASTCDDAARTLKILFPEAFKDEKTVPLLNGHATIFPPGHPMWLHIQVMRTAGSGEQRENGLYLGSAYHYSLEPLAYGGTFLRVSKKS